jgi:transcriptional regulator with XRE-family HTH domain
MSSPAPDPIDICIGSRLRLRRLAMGFSQETLAQALGVTFQQIQKYERGSNRIFSSRLFHLARVLKVPLGYFFEGLSPEGELRPVEPSKTKNSSPTEEDVQDLLGKQETLKLIQAYHQIRDPGVKRQIYALVRSVGEQEDLGTRIL